MRRYLSDTIAMVVFSTAIGAFVEIVISGLTLEQCARVRILAIPVMLLAGRPYGVYRDWCRAHWPWQRFSETTKAVADTWANLSFQLSLYVLLLLLNGADMS